MLYVAFVVSVGLGILYNIYVHCQVQTPDWAAPTTYIAPTYSAELHPGNIILGQHRFLDLFREFHKTVFSLNLFSLIILVEVEPKIIVTGRCLTVRIIRNVLLARDVLTSVWLSSSSNCQHGPGGESSLS